MFVALLLSFSPEGRAQQPFSAKAPQLSKALHLGKTPALRDITPIDPINNKKAKKLFKENWNHYPEIPNFVGVVPMPRLNENALPLNRVDPIRQSNQKAPPSELAVVPFVNMDGVNSNQAGGVAPPDPCGDNSPDHFIQLVNGTGGVRMIITDKNGDIVSGPSNLNNLWSQFNVMGAGDPIVLYDQGADRWLLSEFGNDFQSLMIAISETGDPLGAYNVYQVFGNGGLPDYPKFGIWDNTYLITTNEFTDPFIPVYALDRQAMLDGEDSANLQRFGVDKFNTSEFAWQVASAVDWDGNTPPPPGSPAYVTRIVDDAWGGVGEDRVEIWEIDVDFDSPNQSEVRGPISIPTEPFDSYLCEENSIFECLEQTSGQKISALQQTIMYRTQYRNFGFYEAMVLVFSVDVDAEKNQAGIRWMEIRKSNGGEWTKYQEGTYAPDDLSRWMGSIAMDGLGTIAMGYSVMGEDEFPSLRVTGRRASDPLGVMTVPEYEVVAGNSWNGSERWGDYSAMTVDPDNDQTFWFTGEYKGSGAWRTRIFSFEIERDSNDVGAVSMSSPVSAVDLTDSETVTATFKNYGLGAQSNFDIGYMVNGNVIDVETYTETVEPDSLFTYTFPVTVDLSAVDDYQFKVFTALSEDANVINDTIRAFVANLPRYDAAVTRFANVERPLCEDNVMLGIEITNIGQEPLTSVTVTWGYNAGPITDIDWTGNLATGETDILLVQLEGLNDGENTITASTSNPNGIADEKMGNDELSQTFQSIQMGSKFLTLQLDFDLLPNQTTWNIFTEAGEMIYSGGPYGASEVGGMITEELCIIDDCYTFTIFDSGNNGMCCTFGEGAYSLTDSDGIIVAQGGSFGSSERTDFCQPFECTINSETNIVNESEAGNNGIIFFSVDNAVFPIQYSIDGGETFTTFAIFSGLSAGTYSCVVKDGQNCTQAFEVTIVECAVSFTANVTGVSAAGANDGAININAESAFPPLEYSIDGGANYQDSPSFSELEEGTYNVRVQDAQGCLKSENIMVDIAVGFEEITAGIFVEILPNPTEGAFRIEVKGMESEFLLPIEIIDAAGKVVQRGKLVNYDNILVGRMSLYTYPAGVYFVRFLHPEMREMIRIVRK